MGPVVHEAERVLDAIDGLRIEVRPQGLLQHVHAQHDLRVIVRDHRVLEVERLPVAHQQRPEVQEHEVGPDRAHHHLRVRH